MLTIGYIHSAAVTHNISVETPFSTQDIGKQLVIDMIRDSIPFIIGCHQGTCMGFRHRHFKWVEMILTEFPVRKTHRCYIAASFRLPLPMVVAPSMRDAPPWFAPNHSCRWSQIGAANAV